MGGLFLAQRIHTTPRSLVMRESLKKPLLVAKVEGLAGTAIDEPMRAPYLPVA